MTGRIVAPWFTGPAAAAPPGVDAADMAAAMFEDLYDRLGNLDLVDTAVVVVPSRRPDIDALLWPGTAVHEVARPDASAALAALASRSAEAVLVVAADAPDLPPLLIGKAMRALGTADAAYCEAAGGGGLVFLAARCPLAPWLRAVAPDLDDPAVRSRLHAAAPRRLAVVATPGWHRLRRPEDLGYLDEGLEGWDVTRALLAGRPLRGLG